MTTLEEIQEIINSCSGVTITSSSLPYVLEAWHNKKLSELKTNNQLHKGDIMLKKGMSLEGYLMVIHSEQYVGYDDDMVDDFERWYENISDADWDKYAMDYARLVRTGEI